MPSTMEFSLSLSFSFARCLLMRTSVELRPLSAAPVAVRQRPWLSAARYPMMPFSLTLEKVKKIG